MLQTFASSALLEEAIGKIRDENTLPPLFRKNLRKIGRYLIYEASKRFETSTETINTPLASLEVKRSKHQIVIISVLRAALPMVDSIFEEFEDASLGVVSASRGKMLDEDGNKFSINSDYNKIPHLKDKIAVIVDPMLATASTASYILGKIKKDEPHKIVLVAAIASQYGIDLLENEHPDVDIFCGAVDPILNDKGYIVPGLGDAGDRACNTAH